MSAAGAPTPKAQASTEAERWLMQIGARVRLLRHQAGMTQAGFAQAVGLSGPNVVTRIERGDITGLPVAVLMPLLRYARRAGLSADELLTGCAAPPPKACPLVDLVQKLLSDPSRASGSNERMAG